MDDKSIVIGMQQQVVSLKGSFGCLSDWERMSAGIITWFKYIRPHLQEWEVWDFTISSTSPLATFYFKYKYSAMTDF